MFKNARVSGAIRGIINDIEMNKPKLTAVKNALESAQNQTKESNNQTGLSVLIDNAINATSHSTTSGIWQCDPRFRNILLINNKPIPWTKEIYFQAKEIYWRPSPKTDLYKTACPQNQFHGHFKKFKLHSLIYGIGFQAVSCQDGFVIAREDVGVTHPVWVAINDSLYSDNSGHIVVQITWK